LKPESNENLNMMHNKNEGPPGVRDSADFVCIHPFTMTIAGPTGSGKTLWVKTLLENKQIEPFPVNIIWCYSQWQKAYEDLQKNFNIKFYKGLPLDLMNMFSQITTNLVITDDLMAGATRSRDVCDLFTKGLHLRNLSIICLLQNLYYQGRENRTMSLNTQYMELFKNPRDQQQIAVLARQMYPNDSDRMLQIYKEATHEPYGYLFVDLKPETPDSERLKTDIFKHNYTEDQPKTTERVVDTDQPPAIQSRPQNTIEHLRAMKTQNLIQPAEPHDLETLRHQPSIAF
jgi:hypothetical protein